MSNNIYKYVEDGVISPELIYHGQPARNISFCQTSTQEEYQNAGFYLQVSNKPSITEFQTINMTGEVVDDDNKQVIIQYEVVDHSAETIASIVKRNAKTAMDETLALGKEFNGVIFQCEMTDIDLMEKGLTLAERTGTTSIDCRAMDNSMHTYTIAEFTQLAITLGAHYDEVLRVYWTAIDA